MCSGKSAAEDQRDSEENVGRGLGLRKWCRLTLGVRRRHLTQRVACGHKPRGAKGTRGRGSGTAQIHFWRGRYLGPETSIPGRSVGDGWVLMLAKFIHTATGRQIQLVSISLFENTYSKRSRSQEQFQDPVLVPSHPQPQNHLSMEAHDPTDPSLFLLP